MKGSFWTTLAALVVVVVLILMMTAHQVRFTETAVVTRFEKVVKVVMSQQAGLMFTWPWPIDRVRKFDARLRAFETEFSQLSTEDQKTITVATYATWRIEDPELFLRAVGREEAAAEKIGDLLKNQVSNVLRKHPLRELVNIDPAAIKFDAIEEEVAQGLRREARDVYGIAVASVGIKRLGLPESNTREVFERMKADRKMQIDATVAEGEAKSSEIKSMARTMADKILARADAYAKKLKGEGDARAAQYYEEFDKLPAFTTVILDPQVFPPLRNLQEQAPAEKRRPSSDTESAGTE
jgi:membrane protease subunit HflC